MPLTALLCPPTRLGFWKACAAPVPSGATGMRRFPTMFSATSCSQPPGPPAGRTGSRSASSFSPTAPRPPRPNRCWPRQHKEHGVTKRESDGYTRGSGQDEASPKAAMDRTMQHYVDHLDRVPVLILPCFIRHRTATSGGRRLDLPGLPEPSSGGTGCRLRRGHDDVEFVRRR